MPDLGSESARSSSQPALSTSFVAASVAAHSVVARHFVAVARRFASAVVAEAVVAIPTPFRGARLPLFVVPMPR